MIFDIDNDGDNDVVAIGGGYVNQNLEEYTHLVYVNEGGRFVEKDLGVSGFVGSVIRVSDFDKDGDQDVFIGARVEKFKYPFSPASYVLVNDGGTFTMSDDLSFDIGMVTDAIWDDFDGDGWVDLVIAREWNTLTILQNQEGKSFTERSELFEGKHGAWYSVSAGDFDGDGDTDYIAGNLGLNHRFNVSDEYPMHLYAVDIDDNGTLDPITTAYWQNAEGVMQEYPVNYWDELVAQSPFFRKKFQSYTEFSFGTAGDIFDPAIVNEQNKFKINTTANYILWNENGSFEWQELPRHAQVSPIRKTIVRDFDGDGNLDAIPDRE